jgi:hypothetical protein
MVVFTFIIFSLSCGNWGEEFIYSNIVLLAIVMDEIFYFLFRKNCVIVTINCNLFQIILKNFMVFSMLKLIELKYLVST